MNDIIAKQSYVTYTYICTHMDYYTIMPPKDTRTYVHIWTIRRLHYYATKREVLGVYDDVYC